MQGLRSVVIVVTVVIEIFDHFLTFHWILFNFSNLVNNLLNFFHLRRTVHLPPVCPTLRKCIFALYFFSKLQLIHGTIHVLLAVAIIFMTMEFRIINLPSKSANSSTVHFGVLKGMHYASLSIPNWFLKVDTRYFWLFDRVFIEILTVTEALGLSL